MSDERDRAIPSADERPTASFETVAVRGVAPEVHHPEPVAPPIVQSTTYRIDEELETHLEAGTLRASFVYSRLSNPTTERLACSLAALHGAEDGIVTASGMGALSAAFVGLTERDGAIVAARQLYGTTDGLLTRYLAGMGRRVLHFDVADLGSLEHALVDVGAGAWVVCETISNPLLEVADLSQIGAMTHRHGARLLVDNTFANPALCRPLAQGADLVVESLSKSIAGHSDVHGGFVGGDGAWIERVWDAAIHLGPTLDAHAAALIQRGLQTLSMRTERACRTAGRLARWLDGLGDVLQVFYPKRTFGDDGALRGAMVSFALAGGDERAARFLRSLRLVIPATSLGGVESTACAPYNTSHRTPESRARIGLPDGTIRLSVGCEDANDLERDLAHALEASR